MVRQYILLCCALNLKSRFFFFGFVLGFFLLMGVFMYMCNSSIWGRFCYVSPTFNELELFADALLTLSQLVGVETEFLCSNLADHSG